MERWELTYQIKDGSNDSSEVSDCAEGWVPGYAHEQSRFRAWMARAKPSWLACARRSAVGRRFCDVHG